MNIEYEATFENIEKDAMRERLRSVGATLARPEFLQRRSVYRFPEGHEKEGGWVRVRDEGDKITMSIKIVDGDKIENQKEICLAVDDFEQAKLFVATLGCEEKSYQETLRELWTLDGVEITLDTWPFLNPFVEIEGNSEEAVRNVSERLGFDWNNALFCAVGVIYERQYPGVTEDDLNNHTPKLVFDGENPFLR